MIVDLLRVGDLLDQVDSAGAEWNDQALQDGALELQIAVAQREVQASVQRALDEIGKIVGISEQAGATSRHQALWTSARVAIETLEKGGLSDEEMGKLLLLLARLVVKMRIKGSRPKPSFFDQALNLLKPNQLRFQQFNKETIRKAVIYLENESYRLSV